jgi:hypothetical protein
VTFDGWLAQQQQRDDPIGDLARDAAADPGWPRAGTESDRLLYLADSGAPVETQLVLIQAHREYHGLPQ